MKRTEAYSTLEISEGASADEATRRPTPHSEFPLEVGRVDGVPVVLTVTAFTDERQDVLKAVEGDQAR